MCESWAWSAVEMVPVRQLPQELAELLVLAQGG